MQMWKKYIPNAKVSYLEYDAACATKHKTDIEAAAGGTLYIGKLIHKMGSLVLIQVLSALTAAFTSMSAYDHDSWPRLGC